MYCGGGVLPSVGPWKSSCVCETCTVGGPVPVPGGGTTAETDEVRLNDFEASRCPVSLTCTLKLKSPSALGVPLSVPVSASNVKPGGSPPTTAARSLPESGELAPPPPSDQV